MAARSFHRQLAAAMIAALLGATSISVSPGPVRADTLGASETEVIILGDTEIAYGEPLAFYARVTDVSDSCELVGGIWSGCDWPLGRVDFYAVSGTAQRFLASADL